MKLYNGDCLEEMKHIADNSVDVVFTSPPYADRRKTTYGGMHETQYVEWFLPIAKEIKRVLKPSGSFFLNIKPHTDKGERVLYVFDLVIALKKELGFLFVDEFTWTKTAYPGKYDGRFKNGFEPIYHFTKSLPKEITFNPLECGTPIKQESVERALRRNKRDVPKNGSGMSMGTGMRNVDVSRPSNVINVHNIVNQFMDSQDHPATFPVKLADFFILSFTNKGDVVLDPFLGSGTTGVSAKQLSRDFIGIELDENYYKLAQNRINEAKEGSTLTDNIDTMEEWL